MRAAWPVLLVVVLALPAAALAPLALQPTPLGGGDTVTIHRDAFGVPHIYANTTYGLFWGNGYAQAQDRLFQMDVLRHVGLGNSAEVLGPDQLEMDLATRRELYTNAERQARFDALPPEHKEMFQAYADGVNAFIGETRADPLSLSAEFYAIHHLPEEWTPGDTIAIAEFLLDIFGAGSGGNEVDNAKTLLQLRETLGDEAAWEAFGDLYWMHDASTITSLDPADYTYAQTEAPLAAEAVPQWQWDLVAAAAGATPFAGGRSLVEAAQAVGLPTKFGSNAILVSPALSQNGGALLLGGPQMAYYNPMVPYELALHGAGFEALGMGVAGAPGVIIGRTDSYAWTVTSGSSDQVDAVAFKIHDWDARTYFLSGTTGATATLDCRNELHYALPTPVDTGQPVVAMQEVCRSVRGPVFAVNEDAGYIFVRERTHRLDELRSGLLWLTLARSSDLAAFQAHMESFRFEFNFHVATDDGHIAYFHWGANPDRSDACDPRLPRLAGLCDWEGVRTGSQLPHKVDPATGYIVNWNNKPAQGWSSGDAMEKWGPIHRAELLNDTLHDILAEDGTLSIEDLKRVNIIISTRSPFPDAYVDRILGATAGATDPMVLDARAALADWHEAEDDSWETPGGTCLYARGLDPCFGTYHPGFAIYELWRTRMQEATFRDELGNSTREMGFVPELSSDPHAADHGREDNKENTLFSTLQGATARDWCAPAASCDALISDTFVGALETLASLYETTNVSQWRQDSHTIKFVALSGGPAWRMHMVNRPSFNHYYDFGSGDAGSVLPPGTDQYWFPLDFLRFQMDGTLPDPHKDDQLDLYTRFEWKPAQMAPIGVGAVETFIVGG